MGVPQYAGGFFPVSIVEAPRLISFLLLKTQVSNLLLFLGHVRRVDGFHDGLCLGATHESYEV